MSTNTTTATPTPLTDSEIRETILLTVWEAATPEQRAYALAQSDQRAGQVAKPRTPVFVSLGGAVYAAEEGR